MQLCKKLQGIIHGQVTFSKKRKSISHGLDITTIEQKIAEENADEVGRVYIIIANTLILP